MYTAVIVAGGRGTRLSEYTNEIPKPMVPVDGKPVLEYQIEQFKRYGITDIVITVGYLKEIIKDYFKDGSEFGVNIRYVEENEPLGSGGALYYVKDMVSDTFFVVSGDILFSLSLDRMIDFHKNNGRKATLLAHPNSHPYDSDVVVIDSDNKVVEFNKKSSDRTGFYYHNLVNAGVFILEKSTLEYFTEAKKCNLENDFIKSVIDEGEVSCYRTSEYVKDMGTYERLSSVADNLKNGIIESRNLDNKQKAIFIDRDGTLNVMKGFINNPDDIELEQNVAEAVKKFNDSGYLVIVITNQPVIARGECTLEELEYVNDKVEMLLGEQGAYIDGLYYCPHHPDRGFEGERIEYKIKCNCRKPATGMIDKAVSDYNIDVSKSFMVGDSTMDIQTGINAGCKTVLIRTGLKGEDGKYNVQPDYTFDDLNEFADKIICK